MINLCRILNWKEGKNLKPFILGFTISFSMASHHWFQNGEIKWWIHGALPATWCLCPWTITWNKSCEISSIMFGLGLGLLFSFVSEISINTKGYIFTLSNWSMVFALVGLYSMLLLGDWQWDPVALLASASVFGLFRREGTWVGFFGRKRDNF